MADVNRVGAQHIGQADVGGNLNRTSASIFCPLYRATLTTANSFKEVISLLFAQGLAHWVLISVQQDIY